MMGRSIASVIEQGSVGWKVENTYAQLPAVFHVSATAAKFAAPQVSILNHRLANELGLDLSSLSEDAAAKLFAGQELPHGFQPIAQAYAGHQYGHFTMLGDGRAILLGEHRTPSGKLVDIQLKGAGQTQFSRRGDGRAALGPMLREYLISEAMSALRIPTTRSLAVVTTGESVYRTSALRGAILTRVAASHLRVGTFEYAAALQDVEKLQALADYAIQRHYPELSNAPEKYLMFLQAVIERQASLITQWQLVGFIHGVMNTDNMAISGETIDYGPCAFMNAYRQDTVFSSIDHRGRYAYGNQPSIAQWNLARFAETLLPLIDSDQERAISLATEAISAFPGQFDKYWLAGMRKKLGLLTEQTDDLDLVQSLLGWMEKTRADFTKTFRQLSAEVPPSELCFQDAEFQDWHRRWQLRLAGEKGEASSTSALMRSVNPAVIPRNHRVEESLAAAEQSNDLSLVDRLLNVLASPFEVDADFSSYQEPSPDDGQYRTFCGT